MAINEAYASSRVVVRQDMDLVKVFSGMNTQFVIKKDINLEGKRVVVGEGSVLVFKGGSLSNGTIYGTNTRIKAKNYEIFKRGYVRYRAYIKNGAKKGAPPSMIKDYHDCLIIEGSWSNKKCGTKWTGLLNGSDEDIMLSLKNYVMLHKKGRTVQCPRINALGYETTYFPNGCTIDFNNTIISYPDDLSIWEDKTIPLPEDSQPCVIESGFGLFSLRSNTTISNLTIDGKSEKRQNETIRLGVSCAICVGKSSNVLLKNIKVTNVLGPGVDVNSGAKDITFQDCYFYNIGEHVFYSHQYLGYCHFIGCTFDTWDSERLSTYRNGLNYLFKFAPPVNSEGFSVEEAYGFDLSFTNCTFNNPKRVNTQGRTLGGFMTGYCPVIVNIENCRFTGALPPFNPGNSSVTYASTGKPYRMVVKNSDGAPYAYSAKPNSNIIAEFYGCKNIPFRTVYAKRYENCKLNFDVYENNIENVSPNYEEEFSQPLVIKDCVFTDEGRVPTINHPICHRPVYFEGCTFKSVRSRNDAHSYLISINGNLISNVSFESCEFDIPGVKLVGGLGAIGEVTINKCSFHEIEAQLISSNTKELEIVNNFFAKKGIENKIDVDGKGTRVFVKNNIDIDKNLIDAIIINGKQ